MSMSMSISSDDEIELPDLDDGPDDTDDDERPRSRAKDDEVDEDDDEEKTPEELKAEVSRLRASLAKANSSGNRRRQQLKELRAAQVAADEADDSDDDDESDADEDEKPKQKPAATDARAMQRRIDKAKKETRRQLEEEHKRDLIETRAENAFTRAGVSEKNFRLLKRELDFDEIEFDPKTRSVDGLDEEIDRLRTEFPDLFRGSKAARRRINGGDDRESGRKPKALSTNEQQAALLRSGVR